MTNTQSRYASRSNRPKKPNSMNKILNALIGLVVVLIVITAGFIFIGNDDEEQADSKSNTEETASDNESTENDTESAQGTDTESQPEIGSEEITSEDEETEDTPEGEVTKEESSEEGSTTGGSVTSTPSDDPLVSETISNTAWEPVGTSQTGEHVSIYSKDHVDWNEKVKALTYATGLSADNMIVWRIGNGGSPQKSIGVVSSKNEEEKYRVYLSWVDGEGWRPEKMETLKTLDGAY